MLSSGFRCAAAILLLALIVSPSFAADKEPPKTTVPGLPGVEITEPKPVDPISPRVAEAKTVAAETAAEASAARQSAAEIQERQRSLQRSIEAARQRLYTAHKRHDNLSQMMIELEEELFRQLKEGKEFADLGALQQQRDDVRQQLQAASAEIKDHDERVQDLQSQLLGLQQEQLLAAQDIAARESEAEAARRKRWLVTIREYAVIALPKIVIAIVLLLIVYYAIRFVGRRGINYWSTSGRGTEQQQRDRAQTLISVLDNALYTAMIAIGAIVVLDILKVPVATLLGGVAVVGLAVAFGAQNLIRDYFSGFMILLEDQYKINDVVTINSMTGTVERLTLRITVLRDFEGKVYFIPNGQVTSVINLTHEWSRAVIDVRVGFEQKLERVMNVLLELAEAMHRDPAFAGGILREPELMGVERVEESALVVRLCMVTRPQQKDAVRRELLRRIKMRFDELGISTPIPQRIVFYRPEPGEAEPVAPEAERPPESGNGPAAPRAAVEEA